MKGYELIKEISDGKIKENTQIEVHSLKVADNIIAIINYKNGGLQWNAGTFSTEYLCNNNYYFRIIEDKEDINIQDIKELTYKGKKIGYGSTEQFTDDIDDYCPAINSILDSVGIKINEIIRAVKHLEKTKEDK